MINAISDKLTLLIRENLAEISDEKAEIINFGLKSIFSELIKTLAIFAIANLLGIFKYVLIALLAFSCFRYYAGGIHAKTQIQCFISNSIILFGTVYLSYINIPNYIWLYGCIFAWNCLILYFYAPADVEERPIHSRKLRKQLRVKSYAVLVLIFVIAIFLVNNSLLRNIMIYATFFESLSLLPISYKITKCNHGHKA